LAVLAVVAFARAPARKSDSDQGEKP
jgi:hypothetical protein